MSKNESLIPKTKKPSKKKKEADTSESRSMAISKQRDGRKEIKKGKKSKGKGKSSDNGVFKSEQVSRAVIKNSDGVLKYFKLLADMEVLKAEVLKSCSHAFLQFGETTGHKKAPKKFQITGYEKKSEFDKKMSYWCNAIPPKKGSLDKFEEDKKRSGYTVLYAFLVDAYSSELLDFYTAARELEQDKSKPTVYLKKFHDVYHKFVNKETKGRINVSDVQRKPVADAYEYFFENY
eukprot:CAMPEP_0119016480 /NCGR_PEP_ID=MMETSP1176-20130426/13230_1 /TAXON_ID=265551 /ORGANISM="Synedropsis recta cf, Strain CCMP1620" /LENGTH=233 /DNA_ID=CAMNT_0006969915 /DNA_START=100 /DNA_END=801 /DNA_ORIENTATION=+